MKYQRFADGKLIGVVNDAQRREMKLEHLCGIAFVPVTMPVPMVMVGHGRDGKSCAFSLVRDLLGERLPLFDAVI